MRSAMPRSSLARIRSPTLPFTALGMESTYWGLMMARTLDSSTRVKNACSSDPRKCFRISSQVGGSSNRPRLGFSLPASTLSAVDLPMPLVPTRPSTSDGRGMGRRCSLKVLGP
jgi:hypothetical protein